MEAGAVLNRAVVTHRRCSKHGTRLPHKETSTPAPGCLCTNKQVVYAHSVTGWCSRERGSKPAVRTNVPDCSLPSAQWHNAEGHGTLWCSCAP